MTRHPVTDEPLIDAAETARRLGTPLGTFYDWRKHHYGPKAYKIRGRLLYRWSEVEAWLQAQREPEHLTVVRPTRTRKTA